MDYGAAVNKRKPTSKPIRQRKIAFQLYSVAEFEEPLHGFLPAIVMIAMSLHKSQESVFNMQYNELKEIKMI